jgi:phage terminase small subunit
MPARKPSALTTRHDTKGDRSARTDGEAAMTPKTTLTLKPPTALTGHEHASAVWRRLVGLYFETQGTIITAFDADLLVKYCLAEEELEELYKLRGEIKKLWNTHVKKVLKIKPDPKQLNPYFNALAQANALLQRFQGMDARLDGKRKMVVAMAQSLYLTPRSRAGVAPEEKPPEKPKSEMGDLLDGE